MVRLLKTGVHTFAEMQLQVLRALPLASKEDFGGLERRGRRYGIEKQHKASPAPPDTV